MPSRHVLGVDLGTSGTKVTVLDPERGPVGQGRADYSVIRPAERWAELEPAEVLRAVGEAVRGALVSAGIGAKDVRAVGFTGLVPSLIPVDEGQEPMARCMINLDRRAIAEAERLRTDFGSAALAKITGVASHPKFMASKILWLQSHRPEVYERAALFLQLKDFVLLRLTGRACADPCVAANTFLYDIFAGDWSSELLDYCGVDASRLPDITDATAVVGQVSSEGSVWSNLEPGTPVVCGSDDTTCAMIASRAYRPGGAFENSGTSSHLMVVTDQPVVPAAEEAGRFELCVGLRPELFTLSYINHATGALLHWLHEKFWNGETAESTLLALDAAAQSVPPGAKGLFVLPFVEGAGSPDPNPRARGVIFGLSLQHGRQHLVRAFFEGVAYWLRDSVEDLRSREITLAEIVAGGGLASIQVWRQIKANVVELPVLLVNVVEPTSLGAALLAGEGSAVLADALAAADRFIKVVERSEPSPEASRVYAAAYPVYRQLRTDLKDSFSALADLAET